MCGRYFLHSSLDQLTELFGEMDAPRLAPRYNIAPSQPVPVVHENALGQRQMTFMRWGLVPAWSKGPDNRFHMINARAESIAEKPAYRAAYRYRRCLIPADGFYEWAPSPGGRKPYVLQPEDGKPVAFAGIWEDWMDAEGNQLDSCAVVTTAANMQVRAVHQRMPVILQQQYFACWLDRHLQKPAEVTPLLEHNRTPQLQVYPVGKGVNNPQHDGPELIRMKDRKDA